MSTLSGTSLALARAGMLDVLRGHEFCWPCWYAAVVYGNLMTGGSSTGPAQHGGQADCTYITSVEVSIFKEVSICKKSLHLQRKSPTSRKSPSISHIFCDICPA
jgi:hypothetical protein